MIVFKRFIIINELNESQVSGTIKIENFMGQTRLFFNIYNQQTFTAVIKISSNIYVLDINSDSYVFDHELDINNSLEVIIIKDEEIVAQGSSYGINKSFENLYKTYLDTKKPTIEEYEELPTNEQEQAIQEIIDEQELAKEEEIIEEKIEKKEDNTKEPVFYNKISAKIDELFKIHKREEKLESLIENSKWVRIDIPSESYYVVGIIYEEDKPALICYGIPDKDNTNPPENKGENMQWLKVGEEGYWMMYQSAINGDCLTV